MYVNKSIVKGLMIKQKLKNINIAKRTIFFLGVFVGYAQNVQMIFYWKEFFVHTYCTRGSKILVVLLPKLEFFLIDVSY